MRRALALALALASACASEAPTPLGGPLCVSGSYWTRGDHGDNAMHPGRACIQCHTERRRGPFFSVAGTIFNGYHEEDDCNGNPGVSSNGARIQVEIVDQELHRFIIEPNPSGNFYTTHGFSFPLRRARLISPSGQIAQMDGPIVSGDCNGCHTRLGDQGAPGRIVAPNGGR